MRALIRLRHVIAGTVLAALLALALWPAFVRPAAAGLSLREVCGAAGVRYVQAGDDGPAFAPASHCAWCPLLQPAAPPPAPLAPQPLRLRMAIAEDATPAWAPPAFFPRSTAWPRAPPAVFG